MSTLSVLHLHLLLVLAVCSVSRGVITTITMPTSMNVSWTFPNVESGIESITVSIRYVGPCSEGPPPRDIILASDARSIIINSLEEFSLYNITVSGSVSSGSPVITTATATTKTAQSAAPQNVRVTGVSRTQVFLEWDDIPCLDRNADIEHYRIFGIHVISGNPTRTGISGRASYVVNELSPDMEYTFFVYSFYFDDDGIPRGGRNSRMVYATTMDPTQTPTLEIISIDSGPDDIHVTWRTNGTLSIISYYRLSLRYIKPCNRYLYPDNIVTIQNTSATQYQFLNLEERSYYEVNLTIVLSDGREDLKSSVVITEGESDIRPSISSVIPSPNSIAVTWTSAPESCVTSYEVTAVYAGPCDISNNEQNITVPTSGTSNSATLSGLRVFSKYTVSVTAVNSVTSGSVTILTQTSHSIPGAPTTLQFESFSEETAVVSWQHRCEDQHAIIDAYVVTYGPASTYPEDIEVVRVNASSRMNASNWLVQLNNLNPNAEYKAQVFAEGEHTSSGMKSAIIQIKTLSTTDSTADQQLESSVGTRSNTSVIIAIVVVCGITAVGVLLAVVACIAVAGLVSWKRTSAKASTKADLNSSPSVTASGVELDDCMAYNVPYVQPEGEHNVTRSSKIYESIPAIDNIGYNTTRVVRKPAYDTLEQI